MNKSAAIKVIIVALYVCLLSLIGCAQGDVKCDPVVAGM